MNGTIKNVAIVLGILTVAFGGYYFYVQYAASDTNSATENKLVQDMLSHTQIFISRSQELDQMPFDLSIFEDKRFRSLQEFTSPVKDQPAGRPDPFAAAAPAGS